MSEGTWYGEFRMHCDRKVNRNTGVFASRLCGLRAIRGLRRGQRAAVQREADQLCLLAPGAEGRAHGENGGVRHADRPPIARAEPARLAVR